MDSVNKTLYIPLYGKALVSKKGIIINDKKAEEIWEKEKFPLKRKSKSKWLAFYMAMRCATFDKWLESKLKENPESVVLHLGCGMDSRVERLCAKQTTWFDVDFASVIEERKCYYEQTEFYRMIADDLKGCDFIENLPTQKRAIIVLEGVSMYLTNEQLQNLFAKLSARFERLSVMVDCYTPFAVKMSKLKNPVKEVGVSNVYGVENYRVLEQNTGLKFVKEHQITPQYLIDQLKGSEKFIFKKLYAGKISKKLYKLYEYEK